MLCFDRLMVSLDHARTLNLLTPSHVKVSPREYTISVDSTEHLHIFIKVDVVRSWSAKYPFWNKLHQVPGWKDGLKTTPDIWEIFIPDISKVIALFRKATPIGDILRRARYTHTEVNNLNWTPNKFIYQIFFQLLFLPEKYRQVLSLEPTWNYFVCWETEPAFLCHPVFVFVTSNELSHTWTGLILPNSR